METRKISKPAVEGFLEECYKKGYNEKQAACLLEISLNRSDALYEPQVPEETK